MGFSRNTLALCTLLGHTVDEDEVHVTDRLKAAEMMKSIINSYSHFLSKYQTHTHTLIHIHTPRHTRAHTHTYTHTHTPHTHTHTHTHIYMHTRTHRGTRAHRVCLGRGGWQRVLPERWLNGILFCQRIHVPARVAAGCAPVFHRYTPPRWGIRETGRALVWFCSHWFDQERRYVARLVWT